MEGIRHSKAHVSWTIVIYVVHFLSKSHAGKYAFVGTGKLTEKLVEKKTA